MTEDTKIKIFEKLCTGIDFSNLTALKSIGT